MSEADRALLHVSLLKCLAAVGERGRSEQLLLNDSRMAGFDLMLPELQAELRGFADKKWILRFELPFAGERYRITPYGSAKLAEAGL